MASAVEIKSKVRSPGLWLIVVALVYFVAQVLLFDEQRGLEWDEAVYLGNASSRFPTPAWSVHRAPGMLWVLKPPTLFSESLTVVRWYLSAASAIAVGLGFSRWVRPAGFAAPIGMALFSSTWLALFYGSEASPNLYVAASVVGATGALISFVSTSTLIDLGLSSALVGVTVFLRPADGAVLVAGLMAVAVVALRGRNRVNAVGATLVGAGLGAVPWIVESFERFGGLLRRLEDASSLVETGLTWNLLEYLRLADGPLIGPDPGAVSGTSVIVGAFYGGLALVGIVQTRSRAMALATVALACLMATAYLGYFAVLAPRFLLPAVALVSVAAGIGLLGVFEWRRQVAMVGVVLIALSIVWMIRTASEVHSGQSMQRDDIHRVAEAIAVASDGEGCAFVSQYGYVQMIVASGCYGRRAIPGELACPIAMLQDREPASGIFVAVVGEPSDQELAFLSDPLDIDLPSDWRLYTVPPENAVGCPTDE